MKREIVSWIRLFLAVAPLALAGCVMVDVFSSGPPEEIIETLDQALDKALEECQMTSAGANFPKTACEGNKLGDGVRCLDLSQPRDLKKVQCKQEMDFSVALGVPGLARGNAEVKYRITTESTKNQSVDHSHKCEKETVATCDVEYVYWEVTIEQTTEFLVKSGLGGRWVAVDLGRDRLGSRTLRFCGRKKHPEPRKCGPVDHT